MNRPRNTQKATQIIIIHARGRIVGQLALFPCFLLFFVIFFLKTNLFRVKSKHLESSFVPWVNLMNLKPNSLKDVTLSGDADVPTHSNYASSACVRLCVSVKVDGLMDGPAGRPTVTASYRDARTRLKTLVALKRDSSTLGHSEIATG